MELMLLHAYFLASPSMCVFSVIFLHLVFFHYCMYNMKWRDVSIVLWNWFKTDDNELFLFGKICFISFKLFSVHSSVKNRIRYNRSFRKLFETKRKNPNRKKTACHCTRWTLCWNVLIENYSVGNVSKGEKKPLEGIHCKLNSSLASQWICYLFGGWQLLGSCCSHNCAAVWVCVYVISIPLIWYYSCEDITNEASVHRFAIICIVENEIYIWKRKTFMRNEVANAWTGVEEIIMIHLLSVWFFLFHCQHYKWKPCKSLACFRLFSFFFFNESFVLRQFNHNFPDGIVSVGL